MVVSRVPGHLTWSKEPGLIGDEKFSMMTGGEKEIKKFQGDGLQLQMDSNHRILEIKGDGCRINLTKNCGSVRVVGDGCSVKINENVGDIIYTGDGGRVFLGPDSAKGNVKYFGDGGKVSFDSNFFRRRSKSQSKNRKSSSPDSNIVTIKNESSHYSSTKDKSDSCQRKTKREEELENLKNERKEARQSMRRSKNSDEVGKSRETVIVSTKIVTTTEKDDIVRKWFVCPKSIIKFDENPSVKINKTTINKQTKVLRKKIET